MSIFEQRRQFYQDRLVVTSLELYLEEGNQERVEFYKKQLTEFVSK